MPLTKKEKYTFGDYKSWPENVKCELINGIVYDMTPAPSRKHQGIVRDLLVQFSIFLKDKQSEVYPAPFDVRLPTGQEKDEQIETVVQPDISVICDKKKLDAEGARGAPDLIVEVVSHGSTSKDLREKLLLYEKHKVKEYWIVEPLEKIVMIFYLKKSREYGKPEVYSSEDTVQSKILKGLTIDLNEIAWE